MSKEVAKDESPVSKEQIEEWKKSYGPVFKVDLNDQPYIYRYLMRDEYKVLVDEQYNEQTKAMKEIKDKGNNLEENSELTQREVQKKDNELILLFEEKVLKSCLLYPKTDPNKLPSGLVTSICDEVMKSSGFSVEPPPKPEKL